MYRALQPARARRTSARRPAQVTRQPARTAQDRQPAAARREVSPGDADRDWWRYANMGGAVLDCYQGW
jgi:hypothetical protein